MALFELRAAANLVKPLYRSENYQLRLTRDITQQRPLLTG